MSGRTFLVECYLPGVTRAEVAEAGHRVRAAISARPGDGRTAYLGATLIRADEVVFHAFRADDPGAVEEICRTAAIAYERITESIAVGTDAFVVARRSPDGPQRTTTLVTRGERPEG